jgi:surface antigen
MDDPYPCCDNGGNCTWWAWEQACCGWAKGLPGWGNANQWAGNARANSNYQVLSSPVVHSVAVRASGTYGHVAWVTSVSGSTITVTEQNCWGGYGHQNATYNASFFDGGFVVPVSSQCECQAGQTQSEACGNCGERQRTCGSDCKWAAWGACGGEGACSPGQTDDQACGDCGRQSRTCQADCSWSGFSLCSPTTCDSGAPIQSGGSGGGSSGGGGLPVSSGGSSSGGSNGWSGSTIKPGGNTPSKTDAGIPPSVDDGGPSCAVSSPVKPVALGAWWLAALALFSSRRARRFKRDF